MPLTSRLAFRVLGALLIVAGVVLLAWAILTGGASVVLVFIIPVIFGFGPLGAAAVLMIFGGIAVLMFSAAVPLKAEESEGRPEGAKKSEMGGVVLIGPIPIVFGSAKALKGSWVLVALSVLSLALLLMFLIILFL